MEIGSDGFIRPLRCIDLLLGFAVLWGTLGRVQGESGVSFHSSVAVPSLTTFGYTREDFAMRAFFAPSSVEQLAEASVSIAEVQRWLISRGELPSSPALQRLRAAVVVLTTTPKPRQEDVEPLCASWNLRQKEHKKKRPPVTLITELQQAVLAECSKLRGSFDVQPGASASSAAQPAGPPLVSGAASNAEQPATTKTAAQSSQTTSGNRQS